MRSEDIKRQIKVAANKNIKERDYWLEKLSGELVKSNFPYDYRKKPGEDRPMETTTLAIPGELFAGLTRLSGGSDHKLHMILAAGLVLLLQKYVHHHDIIIGTPIYRQEIAGEFVNTVLALRNTIDLEMTFKEVLLAMRQTIFDAVENQNYPMEALLYQLNLPFNETDFPLFDAVAVLENIQDKDYIRAIHPRMIFSFKRNPVGLEGTIEYDTGFYHHSTVERNAVHLVTLLQQALADVNVKVGEIDILSPGEKRCLLETVNEPTAGEVLFKTVHEAFAAQVEKTPGNIALVFAGESITYLELEEKANRLARYLYQEKGIQADARVGLLMEKSGTCIAAMLGIQEAGGGYVPIDPGLPFEQIRHIVADAGIAVLLSEKKYLKVLNRLQWECQTLHSFLCMDTQDVYKEEEEQNPLMEQKLWEYVGESAVDDITGGGWQSSYTGEPLTKEEMEEYSRNVEVKLTPLLHKTTRVLEIGCATGLTMFRLAPKTGFYYGTDLSPVIIRKNRERVEKEGYPDIKLDCLPAHEIHTLAEKDFDLIILNSVIQHFNGHNYLRRVIAKALDLLGPKGNLFIGDIMDQDKKEALIRDLEDFKNANQGKKYRTKTDWSEELFISRSFFHDLSVDFPVIAALEFSDKIGKVENELTKFRYDVLLRVDKSKKPQGSRGTQRKYKYQEDLRVLAGKEPTAVPAKTEAHYLLYMIYTSGTTGKPKGVMVQHGNMVRLMRNTRGLFDFGSSDIWTMFHSYNFDFSVWEMYGALLYGAKLIVIPRELARDTEQYRQVLVDHEVTVLNQTPSAFYNLSRQENLHPHRELKLRYVIFGGEALDPGKLKEWRDWYPEVCLINMYGITETTVHVTFKDVSSQEIQGGTSNIGKPIPGLKVLILDRGMHLQPMGAVGELCVAGYGVARGYLNNPELTQRKFIFDKFNRSHRSYRSYLNLYKSGDLARYMLNGDLEYLGRLDQQVKIRGFRIELGEIESSIRNHEAVKEVLVVAREDSGGDRFLCAYVVGEPGIDAAGLKEYLAKRLPEYMIPLHFVHLDRIPVTANGKVDRKALPEAVAFRPGQGHIAARDKIESKLVEIWAEVLHIEKEKISMDANFFELGGHSLKATILISNVHKTLEVKVPLAEVFKTPTIQALAQFIREAVKEKFYPLEPVEKKEYYPLSSAQKRYYILQQMKANDLSYNMPRVVELTGKLERERLEEVFRRLLCRHDSLRTSFETIDTQTVQKIHQAGDMAFGLEYHDTDEANASRIIQGFIRGFDLARPPLFRVGMIRLAEERHVLMMDMNHIISDGVSFNIFISDFMALYRGETLGVLRFQYKDFAWWQNGLIRSGQMKKQEDYWLERFKGELPVLNLPVDFPGRTVESSEGHSVYLEMNRTLTAAVNQMVKETGTTLNMVLLAAYNILLSRYTGQEDIIVGSLTTGRNHADLQGIIGLFLNSLALRNFPNENKTFAAFLNEVKENTINDYANQDYQYDDLVARLGIAREGGKSGLFDTLFTCQNLELPEVEIPGLSLKPYGFKHETAKFDLYFDALVSGDTFDIVMKYSSARYQKSTIEKILEHYVEVLEQVTENRETRLKDIRVSIDLVTIADNRFLEEDEDFGIE